jgi:hypothetical protein
VWPTEPQRAGCPAWPAARSAFRSSAIRRRSARPRNQATTATRKQTATTPAKASHTLSTKPPGFGDERQYEQRSGNEEESQTELGTIWALAPEDGIEGRKGNQKRSDFPEEVFDALSRDPGWPPRRSYLTTK